MIETVQHGFNTKFVKVVKMTNLWSWKFWLKMEILCIYNSIFIYLYIYFYVFIYIFLYIYIYIYFFYIFCRAKIFLENGRKGDKVTTQHLDKKKREREENYSLTIYWPCGNGAPDWPQNPQSCLTPTRVTTTRMPYQFSVNLISKLAWTSLAFARNKTLLEQLNRTRVTFALLCQTRHSRHNSVFRGIRRQRHAPCVHMCVFRRVASSSSTNRVQLELATSTRIDSH